MVEKRPSALVEKKAFSRGDKEKALVLGRQRGRAARQGKGQEGRRNGKEEKEGGARRDTGVLLMDKMMHHLEEWCREACVLF